MSTMRTSSPPITSGEFRPAMWSICSLPSQSSCPCFVVLADWRRTPWRCRHLDYDLGGIRLWRGSVGYTLYYTTSFIFTGLAFARRLSGRTVQHRRRRSGLYWRIGGRSGLSSILIFCPLPLLIPLAIARRSGLFGSGLGTGSCLAAGISGQPCGDHHHHVQFHRLIADRLPTGQSDVAGRGRCSQKRRTFIETARLPFIHEMFCAVDGNRDCLARRLTCPSSGL